MTLSQTFGRFLFSRFLEGLGLCGGAIEIRGHHSKGCGITSQDDAGKSPKWLSIASCVGTACLSNAIKS